MISRAQVREQKETELDNQFEFVYPQDGNEYEIIGNIITKVTSYSDIDHLDLQKTITYETTTQIGKIEDSCNEHKSKEIQLINEESNKRNLYVEEIDGQILVQVKKKIDNHELENIKNAIKRMVIYSLERREDEIFSFSNLIILVIVIYSFIYFRCI